MLNQYFQYWFNFMWKLSRTVVPLGEVKRTRIFRSSFGGGLKIMKNLELRIKN